MTTTLAGRKITAWAILALILLTAALLVLFGPAEATIGQGIQIVYVHVALIWTGMLGLLLVGLLGLIVLLALAPRLQGWMETAGWVSLVFFGLGVGTSLIAEIVNWGGIAWQEPRTAANLNLLAFATIMQVAGSLLGRPRLQGLFHAFVAGAILWSAATTDLQLHPSGAISSSSSALIQFTFYGLTTLCCLAAAWFVWAFGPRPSQEASQT